MELKQMMLSNLEKLKDLDKKIKMIRDSDAQNSLYERRNELIKNQNNLLKKLKG